MSATKSPRVLRFLIGSALVACATAAHAAPNVLEVVVGNGPFAGTYKPPVDEVFCIHAKQRSVYIVSWKNFSPSDPRAMSEGGLNVFSPDQPGAKSGDVHVAFGIPDKKSVEYDLSRVPMTLKSRGKGADVAAEGRTKDGVALRISAQCNDVEEM